MRAEEFSTNITETSAGETAASLLCTCAYNELIASDKTSNTAKDEPAFLVFANNQEKPDITQKSVDDYVKSFENLQKNGTANKETLDAFKEACKSLKNLDEAGLKKTLEDAAKNPKVEMMLVAMHLKEVLETNGFKKISGDFKRNEGGFVLKHDKGETYLQVSYSGKTAQVQIEHKSGQE